MFKQLLHAECYSKYYGRWERTEEILAELHEADSLGAHLFIPSTVIEIPACSRPSSLDGDVRWPIWI
jgi:hypothetical protein